MYLPNENNKLYTFKFHMNYYYYLKQTSCTDREQFKNTSSVQYDNKLSRRGQ